MNELLFIVSGVLSFFTVALIARLLGKPGLIAWIAVSTVLANIAVTKQVNLFGMENALGNIMFSSTYLATDIISEVYGKKESNKGVIMGLISAVTFVVFGIIVNMAKPNGNDFAGDSLATIMTFTLRTTSASIISYFLSNLADVWLFEKFRQHSVKRLWLRNNVCTIVCNCTENFLFAFLGFWGIFTAGQCIAFACAGCLIEMLAGLMDTPFVYLGRKWAKKHEGIEEDAVASEVRVLA